MIIGIDASNLRSGGAITHLTELLRYSNPQNDNFDSIIIFGEKKMLDSIDEKPWITKVHESFLDKSLLHRLYWQKKYSADLARKYSCDVLFIPCGIVLGNFHPVVSMSHNLLPFEMKEIKRYGFSWQAIRNLLLRFIQSRSYKKADGMIFLSNYAKEVVTKVTGLNFHNSTIIPHGINPIFSLNLNHHRAIANYNNQNPFKLIYVSTIDMYKHQWNVIHAVKKLREKGFPLVVEFIGGANPKALEKFQEAIKSDDLKSEFTFYQGNQAYEALVKFYKNSDMIVYASSCENMPNILLEGMATGLPIACSNMGPMPEVLQDAGVYFNPDNVYEIENAIEKLIKSKELREDVSAKSFKLSQKYNWEECSRKTFSFLLQFKNNKRNL